MTGASWAGGMPHSVQKEVDKNEKYQQEQTNQLERSLKSLEKVIKTPTRKIPEGVRIDKHRQQQIQQQYYLPYQK